MPLRFERRGRSVYRRYFVTYCSIALIPVIAVVVCLVVLVEKDHTATARGLYRQAIVQASSHIDGFVMDLQSSVDLLDSDARTGEVLDDPKDSAMAESVLTEYLAKVEENSRIPFKMLYYCVGDTVVFTSEGRMPYQQFEADFAAEANLTMSSFFTQLNTVTAMKAWLLRSGSARNTEGYRSYIAFAFPTFKYNAFKRGTVAYLVSMQDMLDVVAEYLGEQPDYLYLYNANYDLIGRYESTLLPDDMRTRMMRMNNNVIQDIRLDENVCQVMRYKTDRYGFQIVCAVQLNRMYGDLSWMQSRLMLIGAAVMLVVGAVAILLARYSYRPIRALLKNLGEDASEDENLPEFERIDQHLSSMNREVESLKTRLSSQLPMVRDRILQGLLRGTLTEDGLRQLSDVCPDIRLEGRNAYVALISLEEGDQAACQPFLEKIDLGGADGHGVYLEEERIFALLILTSGTENGRDAQCAELLSMLRQRGVRQARIGVGNVIRGAESIPRSYLEAFIALNSAQQRREEQPVCYERIGEMDYAGDHADEEANAIGIYLQSVRSVDEKTALDMMDTLRLTVENACSSALNISYTRFDLFSKALAVCEKEVAGKYQKIRSAIGTFSDARTFWSMMAELTRDNCQAVTARRDQTQNQTGQMIVETVRAHCCEADFSLQRLSEMVGYSATYINRCLRERTGYSFIQMISILRIAKAKEELLYTDHMIKSVVEHAGYLDMASFTRKFKELEGVTPSEYRKINSRPDV